jgi:hypothetical protein
MVCFMFVGEGRGHQQTWKVEIIESTFAVYVFVRAVGGGADAKNWD